MRYTLLMRGIMMEPRAAIQRTAPGTAVLLLPAFAALLLVLLLPAPGPHPSPGLQADPHPGQVYSPLVPRLSQEGFAEEQVRELLLGAGAAFYPDVVRLHLARAERESPYLSMDNPRAVAAVRAFLQENSAVFQAAYRAFGVDPATVAALLYVESRFGKNTGDRPVLYVLSSVSLDDEPWLLEWMVGELDQRSPGLSEAEREELSGWIAERARSRADWAYRELIALLTMAGNADTDVRELRGSWAGAFGIPQFLPSSFLQYAVDGDGDGDVDLHTLEDAVASVSHYLAEKGWEETSPLHRRMALWAYNHSWHYVDLIEKLARAAGEDGTAEPYSR
jgi:membrane-bound lytic murein transglycosylase B